MKQKYLAKSLELLKKILQKWRYKKSAKGVILFWAILGYLISNTSKSVPRARIHFIISVVTISGLLCRATALCTLIVHGTLHMQVISRPSQTVAMLKGVDWSGGVANGSHTIVLIVVVWMVTLLFLVMTTLT